MASNDYSATAANVLSSLHIKGASVTGGTGRDGYVPVLGTDGKLDSSVISLDELSTKISIAHLPNTAYVSYNTDGRPPSYDPDGSIALPFVSVTQASSEGFDNFIVESGDYDSVSINLTPHSSSVVRIFSTGQTSFSNLSIAGYSDNTRIVINGVSVSGTLSFSTYSSGLVVDIEGTCSISTVSGQIQDPDDPMSEMSLETLTMSSEAKISNLVNVGSVEYASDCSRIGNSSTSAPGTTVKDALDGLGTRKIRIPKFKATSSGIAEDGTTDVLVSAGSQVYDISSSGTSLVSSANTVFHKDGDSPSYSDVTADTMTATDVTSHTVETQKVTIGNGTIKVTDNFLEIE